MAAAYYTITEGVTLASRTSMGLGGRVIAEVRLDDERGCEALPELEKKLGGRVVFLGAGTNIIASDAALPLVLATLQRCDAAVPVGADGGEVLLRVAGGMPLPLLLARAASLGLGGLEGLSGIPGSVGGAVAMNAGSFGTEIGRFVRGVRVYAPCFGIADRPGGDVSFAYRRCTLAGHDGPFLVLGVTLALPERDGVLIKTAMRDVMGKKKASQPVTAKSAGCVFKNPAPDAPAGRLLEEAGFKGRRDGGMAFSSLHANFLVNEGGGTAEQAFALIARAREAVRGLSGFDLETEVKIWR